MAERLYRVGILATDTPGEIKTFYARATGGNYDVFKTAGGVAYQVTAGKTLYIIKYLWRTATAANQHSLLYGDDAKSDDPNAPVNPVDMSGLLFGKLANEYVDFKILFTVPAGKYPHIKTAGANGSAIACGIEL